MCSGCDIRKYADKKCTKNMQLNRSDAIKNKKLLICKIIRYKNPKYAKICNAECHLIRLIKFIDENNPNTIEIAAITTTVIVLISYNILSYVFKYRFIGRKQIQTFYIRNVN